MVLKLVDTRVEKNSKCEMYVGYYLGIPVDVAKIYKRATVLHAFKLTSKMYQCQFIPNPFSSFGALRKGLSNLSTNDPEGYKRMCLVIEEHNRSGK